MLRFVDKSGSTESFTDAEVVMLALTASTADLDNQLFPEWRERHVPAMPGESRSA
jgi:hypothetical protein